MKKKDSSPSACSVFDRYVARFSKSERYKFTKKRQVYVADRLKTFTQAELIKAVDSLADSDFHRDNGFIDFKYAVRSDEQVQMLLDRLEKGRNGTQGNTGRVGRIGIDKGIILDTQLSAEDEAQLDALEENW